jgi:pyruvate dehydrogenase E1 component beta subunit
MAHLALQAASALAEEEIEAEVVDVRSIAPLDTSTLIASARKTGRVLVVEEGPLTGGISGEISARISEGAFGALAAPVRRLAMPDVPVPSARELERAVMPSAPQIADAARALETMV